MESLALIELSPHWLKRTDDTHFQRVDTIDEADGVLFLCPLCFLNKGKTGVGVHSVLCWAPSVPQTTSPTPGRWTMEGTSEADLTLVAGSSSILLTGPGCGAHFFIRSGRIEWT